MTLPGEPSRPGRYARALVLAAVAGAVDAVGFLHFRSFYVSFMSGNTTRIAVALAEGDDGLALRGGTLVACFVVGVIAGDLLTGAPADRQWATLLVEAALLLAAAATGAGIASSLLLAAAMGAHNALVLRAERVSIALTYVTGSLVHLGRAVAALIARRPDKSPGWPYAGLWLALFAGACVGGATSHGQELFTLTALASVLAILAAMAFLSNRENER